MIDTQNLRKTERIEMVPLTLTRSISMKTVNRFVYIESKTKPGVFQYYQETFGTDDSAVNEIAQDVINRNERCLVVSEFCGSTITF